MENLYPVKIALILLYVSCFFKVDAQENLPPEKKYAIYFELAGSGGIASFNFEKDIFTRKISGFKFRAGFSVAPVDKNNGIVLVFPCMIHYLLGKSKHKFDVGIGQTFSITTKGNFFLMAPLSAGYRLEPENKNYFWRFSYTPIVSYLVDFQWQNWGGITFGIKL